MKVYKIVHNSDLWDNEVNSYWLSKSKAEEIVVLLNAGYCDIGYYDVEEIEVEE